MWAPFIKKAFFHPYPTYRLLFIICPLHRTKKFASSSRAAIYPIASCRGGLDEVAKVREISLQIALTGNCPFHTQKQNKKNKKKVEVKVLEQIV